MCFCRRNDSSRREVEQVENEFIGMLRLDPKGSNNVGWKIAKVHRDDHVRLSSNGSGKDVSVVRIGQLEAGDQIFVAGDEGVGGMQVHQRAGSFEFLPRQVWALFQ